MAQAESVAVLHSSWHTDLSLDKHKVPASSISVFLSMFFKLELEKDIPFPFGQKASCKDVHPRQLCLLLPQRNWSESMTPEAGDE